MIRYDILCHSAQHCYSSTPQCTAHYTPHIITDHSFPLFSGVVEYSDLAKVSIADIPGLVDGASENKGLGHDFLRHIERTKVRKGERRRGESRIEEGRRGEKTRVEGGIVKRRREEERGSGIQEG